VAVVVVLKILLLVAMVVLVEAGALEQMLLQQEVLEMSQQFLHHREIMVELAREMQLHPLQYLLLVEAGVVVLVQMVTMEHQVLAETVVMELFLQFLAHQ
jgi:hypothetical protein